MLQMQQTQSFWDTFIRKEKMSEVFNVENDLVRADSYSINAYRGKCRGQTSQHGLKVEFIVCFNC